MSGSIEARLRLLEDERSILQALYGYGYGLDYGDEEGFLDCFTDDALLVWPEPHRPYRGREEIRGVFRRHTHAPEVFHKHFLVEPRIVVDGDRATVESYFARLDSYPEGPQVKSFGRYRDVVVRCPDGRWRIQERRNEREAGRVAAVPYEP